MKNLHFKGKFRSYQQKVLDNLNAHLKDNKLHIVAAPGAGKTTLGCDIISLDIKNPKPITTYQSLWSVFSNKKEVEIIKGKTITHQLAKSSPVLPMISSYSTQ